MSETAPPPLKILIADDEANIRRILETRLRMQGYEVAAAVDGAEAVELFRGFEPDLVVLDLMLPDMGGLEVCRQLKSRDDTKDIPIVMVTAKGEESDIVVGIELGAAF